MLFSIITHLVNWHLGTKEWHSIYLLSKMHLKQQWNDQEARKDTTTQFSFTHVEQKKVAHILSVHRNPHCSVIHIALDTEVNLSTYSLILRSFNKYSRNSKCAIFFFYTWILHFFCLFVQNVPYHDTWLDLDHKSQNNHDKCSHLTD